MVQPHQHLQAWREVAGTVVVSFVEAVNRFDADRLIDLFAQDAHVNDQLRDFWGRDAIGGWIRREIVGDRFYMRVLDARMHFGDVFLSAEVGGEFDKTGLPEPLVLSFLFSMREEKIVRLVILMTRAEQTEPEIRRPGT